MASHAFQLIEGRSAAGEGAFGTGSFGDSPFGGERFEPFYLPQNMIKGDEVGLFLNRQVARIVHERDDIPFQVRRVTERKVFKFHFMGEPRSYFDPAAGSQVLWTFFDAQVFYYISYGPPVVSLKVLWVGTSYRPVPHRADDPNGAYDIEFSVIEVR